MTLNLKHLETLTDTIGLFESTTSKSPTYCTDTNSLALILTCQYWGQTHNTKALSLCTIYFSFLQSAFNPSSGCFLSPTTHGRCLWALGVAMHYGDTHFKSLATHLFDRSIDYFNQCTDPHALSFGLMGLYYANLEHPTNTSYLTTATSWAEKIAHEYTQHQHDNWHWFSRQIPWGSAFIPKSLILIGQTLQEPQIFSLGIKSLKWLIKSQHTGNHFEFIGNKKCIEAYAMTSACVEAFQATQDKFWLPYAENAFQWFLGKNKLSTPLIDNESGGCKDNLQTTSTPQNQGAESTLAWLLSVFNIQALAKSKLKNKLKVVT